MNEYYDENQYDVQAHPTAYRIKPKKRKSSWTLPVAFALVFSLLGSALGAGGILLVQNYGEHLAGKGEDKTQVSYMLQGQRDNAVIETVNMDTSKEMTPAQVYAANVRSTVGITTSITGTNFWGYQTTSAASGSGFIITTDGYVLTNHHVIEGSSSITVTTYDGQVLEAALIGSDESNDIAVLKVEGKDLTPVILGDSDNLNVGDPVVAIGNPLGELTFSLTSGAISAMDREVTFSGGTTMNLLQTDCAINSGNSGGALFNLHGEVIGVTNAKYSSSSSGEASIDNIGFAIPINSIRAIVEGIMEKGYFAKPYIGLSVADVSQESQMYGLPAGAAVYALAEDSPAEQSGLQVGDIIVKLGDTTVTGGSHLVELVRDAQIGDELTLTVYRQGDELTITVTVAEKIQSAAEEAPQQGYSGYGSYPGYGFGNGY